MITFVSIFLGLVSGVQPVELAVSGPVTAVILQLDGRTVAELDGPPWRHQVDLGRALRPRRLSAIALDASGHQLTTIEQRLNWPRPQVEANLLLGDWRDGLPQTGRLIWETSQQQRQPQRLQMSVDGQPIPVADPNRFALPPLDPGTLHFVRAEIDFSETLSATAEATFGGTYGSAVETELSPIPVLGKSRQSAVVELEGLLLARGQPLRVAAIEYGPAEVVVVRDDRARPGLGRLARQLGLRTAAPLFDSDDVFRLLSTRARSTDSGDSGDSGYKLYPVSKPLSTWHQPVVTVMAALEFEALDPTSHQDLGEAVAVAGLRAAASRRRRAVVLITSGQQRTYGRWQPAEVRTFLGSLGVPLVVWNTNLWQEADDGWGKDRSIAGRQDAQRAFADLRRLLSDQRIVWVEGRHLPHEVELAKPGRRLVRLVR